MTATGYDLTEMWFLTSLRNAITDPISRGEDKTDVFTYDTGAPVFTLANNRVQNIKSVTLNSTLLRWGYDYNYAYGEKSAATTVTLTATPAHNDTVTIVYHRGVSSTDRVRDGQTIPLGGLVDRGFFRSDNAKPKIMVMRGTVTYERMGIGPNTMMYAFTPFVIEVYTDYAKQNRDLSQQVANAVRALEIPTLGPSYNLIEAIVDGIEPFDWQEEFKAHMTMITAHLQTREAFQ